MSNSPLQKETTGIRVSFSAPDRAFPWRRPRPSAWSADMKRWTRARRSRSRQRTRTMTSPAATARTAATASTLPAARSRPRPFSGGTSPLPGGRECALMWWRFITSLGNRASPACPARGAALWAWLDTTAPSDTTLWGSSHGNKSPATGTRYGSTCGKRSSTLARWSWRVTGRWSVPRQSSSLWTMFRTRTWTWTRSTWTTVSSFSRCPRSGAVPCSELQASTVSTPARRPSCAPSAFPARSAAATVDYTVTPDTAGAARPGSSARWTVCPSRAAAPETAVGTWRAASSSTRSASGHTTCTPSWSWTQRDGKSTTPSQTHRGPRSPPCAPCLPTSALRCAAWTTTSRTQRCSRRS